MWSSPNSCRMQLNICSKMSHRCKLSKEGFTCYENSSTNEKQYVPSDMKPIYFKGSPPFIRLVGIISLCESPYN